MLWVNLQLVFYYSIKGVPHQIASQLNFSNMDKNKTKPY